MNTHTNPQFNQGAPRVAGRPGKYASGPITSRTVFREGKPDRLLTISEVLEALGIARSTWNRWACTGNAPPMLVLPNGALRVWESDLVRWARSKELS
jgi:predicted DNA-binding transcriptional regulator AlpA